MFSEYEKKEEEKKNKKHAAGMILKVITMHLAIQIQYFPLLKQKWMGPFCFMQI